MDTIIADVFGLLSLFFLTIGKSRETPATYSQIASMRVSFITGMVVGRRAHIASQQMLLHLDETGAYTEAYLEPIQTRLAALKQIVNQDSEDGKHPEAIVRLMRKKLNGVGE